MRKVDAQDTYTNFLQSHEILMLYCVIQCN